MAKKESKGDENAPKKKSRKKLIIIVLAAVLLLGGATGGYLLLGSSGGAPPAPKPGAVVALDPITINLADGHYLKVALALQATADAGEELDGSKALDLAIDYFGDVKMAQLSTSAGRRSAKKELVERMEKAYEGEVMDIYFREFVMQ